MMLAEAVAETKVKEKFDSSAFAKAIEAIVKTKKLGYLDALAWYCESNRVEFENVAKMVKKCGPIWAKLEAECTRNRLLNRGSVDGLKVFFA